MFIILNTNAYSVHKDGRYYENRLVTTPTYSSPKRAPEAWPGHQGCPSSPSYLDDGNGAGVSMGTYATVLFILGLGERLADLADVAHDRVGLQLEEQNLPKRIRTSNKRQPKGTA
jgi:hypothetical protein